MIGGNLTIGDELSDRHRKKDVNKAEISPERLRTYIKVLKANGFLGKLKGNKLSLSQTEINEYLQSNLGLIERLETAEVEFQKDRINFKLSIKLLKSSTPTEVSTSAKLTRYKFDVNHRTLDFEIIEPQDVITNEVVAYLISGIIIRILQVITNARLEMAKVLQNREFIDVLCNRIGFDLNKSPYLATIFGSKIGGVPVFDFVKIKKIEILPGEIAVYPNLTMLT